MTKLVLIKSTVLVVALTFFSSCIDEEIQARKSIQGSWKVVRVESQYGEFFFNQAGTFIGHDQLNITVDSGNLGFFNFTNEKVSYEYVRNDTTRQGEESWVLTEEKIGDGFVKTPKFKLEISNTSLYEVKFEDGTKRSTKNASEMQWISQPQKPGFGVLIILDLVKD